MRAAASEVAGGMRCTRSKRCRERAVYRVGAISFPFSCPHPFCSRSVQLYQARTLRFSWFSHQPEPSRPASGYTTDDPSTRTPLLIAVTPPLKLCGMTQGSERNADTFWNGFGLRGVHT